MAESVIGNYFPSQAVSDLEKITYNYGLKVAKAIDVYREYFQEGKPLSQYIIRDHFE